MYSFVGLLECPLSEILKNVEKEVCCMLIPLSFLTDLAALPQDSCGDINQIL